MLFFLKVRIETSGPEFRGFAIQARESTATFSSSAAFVGEFVNPPSGGDWRIWTCDAVSNSYHCKKMYNSYMHVTNGLS